jgi:hypothetical protein
MTRKIILLSIVTFCTVNAVSAKARIPFGKMDKLEIVADLPNTEAYAVKEGSKEYLDLARLHQEYNIAWLPAWITQEPKLVLAQKDSDEYFEPTKEQLEQIISENKLNKESLIQLGFYRNYGGKLILLVIIGLIIYGVFPKSKTKEVKPTNI